MNRPHLINLRKYNSKFYSFSISKHSNLLKLQFPSSLLTLHIDKHCCIPTIEDTLHTLVESMEFMNSMLPLLNKYHNTWWAQV